MSPWLDLSCNIISSNFDDPILCKNNYLDFASSLVIHVFQSYQDIPETLIAMENIKNFIDV